ncbi:DUF1513 domain-containing protein [Iodobacter fluviatilis]|uniref:Protein of uncharacterized function (DUF1513) n=1 Tax=Iodobacter fluviatilis TaxID=537 RepID=A0A377SYJ7_9NEIS|nr:DUF1513 domain-containing protein [Iodobacter fluviatilis]TCU81369.1 hypothetical protein EV682_1227 [Iodobacter fluviatilis]STR46037.1 Protein of uncharacterised function (DUF1513) [Iodobacter fluviatilis]
MAIKLSRRRLLQSLALLALPLPAWAAGEAAPVLLAAQLDKHFGAVGGSAIATPTRGHGIIPIAGKEAILLARRPGYWMMRINWQTGEIVRQIAATENRHFFGHAVLSPDGRTLLTSENNIQTGQGIIGLYHPQTLQRLGELPSHGIGPHELLFIDSHTLAIANGGILTLPASGREKLNLASMQPSVVLLAWPSGQKISEHSLPDTNLSLRHLALSRDGALGIAIQAESPTGQSVDDAPLLAILRDGKLSIAETVLGLGGYAASIAAVGTQFILSCLEGNALAIWDSQGKAQRQSGLLRPAGIAPWKNKAYISTELGIITLLDPEDGTLTPISSHTGIKWDNHLILV